MARIRVARGSRSNLPGALDENTLLYGEMYWEREQLGTSDGVLYMGKPDGVEDGENDKSPLAIAGARAMRSLYFQGLWDPSTGSYPTGAQVGDIYVAEADGTGPASTFKYGDWAVCIGKDNDTSQWLKAINQAITTEDPLGHDRNPLQLNEGVLKLKYDPATLKLNANGELTVSHTEVYTTESSVHIDAGQPVALNSDGKAIVADCSDVDTSIVIGLAAATAEPGDFVTVQRADLVKIPLTPEFPGFVEVGAPIYLYLDGTFTQDVEQIAPGFVLQQVGIATDVETVDVHIGTPFQIDAGSDIYYIPLTQTITAGDRVHAPSSAAVHQIVQQLTNLDAEVLSKKEEDEQEVIGPVIFNSAITFEEDSVAEKNFTVKGNLDVQGSVTTINTGEVEIADNIIRVNSNQTNTPSSVLEGGMEIWRGSQLPWKIIFQESTQTVRIGPLGNTRAVMARNDVIGSTDMLLSWDTENRVAKAAGVRAWAGATLPSATAQFNINAHLYATRVYNAVWNDIADFIEVPDATDIQYGRVYVMSEDEAYAVASKYLPEGIIGIASDTYGFGVGQKQDVKQLPVAIGGFVLAHVDQKYAPGTPLTATTAGALTEIKLEDKRDYPERIIATYWKPEPNTQWNGILVNGRHWVKIK